MTHPATGDALARRLVPDELWRLAEPLVPSAKVRPQGGGRVRIDHRAVFVSVVFVLTSGCAWRAMPVYFGIAAPTAYRRYVEWTQCGLFTQLRSAAAIGSNGELAGWTAAIAAAAAARSGTG